MEKKPSKRKPIYSEETGEFNFPETSISESAIIDAQTEEPTKQQKSKRKPIYSEETGEFNFPETSISEPTDEIEDTLSVVTPEEIDESESLAKKAYRLVDVAGEGLLRGWKSEAQAALETKVLPYLFSSPEEAEYLKTRYKPAKEEYQKLTEETKKMMPRASYVAEMGGGLLPYALFGVGAGLKANALLGALEGAVTAGGKSEADIGSKEFLKEVATGAGLGGALGGAATKLLQVAPRATLGTLIGAGAAPIVGGDISPGETIAGGALGLATALATRGKKVPATGIIGKLYEAGKEGTDLLSDEARKAAVDKVAKNATQIAEGVKAISEPASKKATDVIFTYYDDQIRKLGNFISKETADINPTLSSFRTKVWKDLESYVNEFVAAHPNKTPSARDIVENITNSLRKGIKESLSDPADIQSANNIIDIINNVGKIEDSNVVLTIKEIFKPLSTKPEITKTISGVSDPIERELLEKMSIEELKKAGFRETVKPSTVIEKPGTISETLGITSGDETLLTKTSGGKYAGTERTIFGKEGEPIKNIRQRLEKPFEPTEIAEKAAPSVFVAQKTAPEGITKATTSVFEKFFPGRSNLENVNLAEILKLNVKLNDIIRSSKSEYSKSVLLNAKKQLAEKEAQLVAGTKFSDVATRRELYGALKEAEDIFKTEDTAQIFKLIDDMVTAKMQGRFKDFETALNAVKQVDPKYAGKLENVLLEKGASWKNLVARQKANPIEKVQTLIEEGIELTPQVKGSRKVLQEIEAMQKTAGTIDPETGLPTRQAYQFAQNLGELGGGKAFDPKLKAQLDEAIELIRGYDPDLAESIITNSIKDADILRLMNILKRGAEFGFVPTTTSGALIKALQLVGATKGAYFLGKGVGGLQRGISSIAKPFVSSTQKIMDALNSDIGTLGKFDKPLRSAAQRGDAALRSTIYMLSQQYPEFREYMDRLEKE
jgi:hypothetical protein